MTFLPPMPPVPPRPCAACDGTGEPLPFEHHAAVWWRGVRHLACGACRGSGRRPPLGEGLLAGLGAIAALLLALGAVVAAFE